MTRARLGPWDRLPQALPPHGPPALGQGSEVGKLAQGTEKSGGGRGVRDQVTEPSIALLYAWDAEGSQE